MCIDVVLIAAFILCNAVDEPSSSASLFLVGMVHASVYLVGVDETVNGNWLASMHGLTVLAWYADFCDAVRIASRMVESITALMPCAVRHARMESMCAVLEIVYTLGTRASCRWA